MIKYIYKQRGEIYENTSYERIPARGGGGLNKAAFTMAEVLITLGIIGIVAAMTLPSLIQKHRDKVIVTQVRKVYSDINNAIIHAQADFGVIGDNSQLFNPNNTSVQTAENFAKYFTGAKVCRGKTRKECKQYYPDIKYATPYVDSSGTNAYWVTNGLPTIILQNGAVLYIQQRTNPDCYGEETWQHKDEFGNPILDADGNVITSTSIVQICAMIMMDVNGNKSPNRFGQDVQTIHVFKKTVEPTYQKMMGSESFKNILQGVLESCQIRENVSENN